MTDRRDERTGYLPRLPDPVPLSPAWDSSYFGTTNVALPGTGPKHDAPAQP